MHHFIRSSIVFIILFLGLTACGGTTQPARQVAPIDDASTPQLQQEEAPKPRFLNAYADW